ncbi:MAG TPA: GNAT family N-acetyltransferase [Candidatus Eremiobacteraceae bacterium]|nr:GNAT family N-acetyltransferase [Candidatus Eremiobacteraceae bacterium]
MTEDASPPRTDPRQPGEASSIPAQFNVGPIDAREIPDAVAIFLEAFHDSAAYVYGEPPRPDAMIDVWSFARSVEPDAFLAARDGAGAIVGYEFLTSSVGALRSVALRRLVPLRWLWRAVSGQYGIVWAHAFRLFANKFSFVRSAGDYRTKGDAQLLNIATAARVRGRGVAGMLVGAGLTYLRSRGVAELRLEVRPDNLPALTVYQHAGFKEVGRTKDAGGEWIVMTARP